MPLLAEYAITPDVFDQTCYGSDEIGAVYLQHLKEVLLSEGLVRNLRGGEWLSLLKADDRPWHLRGKELLKKLIQQGRLRLCKSCLPVYPSTDAEWCQEALSCHAVLPLNGIVATRTVADRFSSQPLVASIDQLPITAWWAGRSPSVRLRRSRAHYKENLHLVLECANSIMFIDPHIDPSLNRYSDLVSLIGSLAGRNPVPLIEIHRVCYVGSGPNRSIVVAADWKRRFRIIEASLVSAGLSVEVFVWDDFHDRYLISDLIGISIPYGFDTTTDPTDITTWTRLGRQERDDIQKEFHPASNRHALRHQFRVP